MLHGGEMVLPKQYSDVVQNAAASGGSKGGGNSLTVHQTIQNQGLTDANFKAMATKHAAHLTKSIIAGGRKLNLV